MKRAETKITGTSFFQFNELTYYINYIDAAKYLLYGILTYQFVYPLNKMSKTTKIIKREKHPTVYSVIIYCPVNLLYSKNPIICNFLIHSRHLLAQTLFDG